MLGAYASFPALVISSFGFNQFNTLLVGLPSSVVSAGSLITWSLFARKYGGLRTIGMAVPLIPAIAGISTVYATTHGEYSKWGRAVSSSHSVLELPLMVQFAYWLVNSYAVCWPFLQGKPKPSMTDTLADRAQPTSVSTLPGTRNEVSFTSRPCSPLQQATLSDHSSFLRANPTTLGLWPSSLLSSASSSSLPVSSGDT